MFDEINGNNNSTNSQFLNIISAKELQKNNITFSDTTRLSLNSDNQSRKFSFSSNTNGTAYSSNTQIFSRAPSFESSANSTQNQTRPVTARSLPSKVLLALTKPDQESSTSLSAPKVKLINVSSKDLTETLNDELELNSHKDLIHSLSNPVFDKIRKYSSPNMSLNGKSKLDNFIEYSMNPFTTRFEIIGDKKSSNTSETNLKVDDNSNFMKRSKSINTLNDIIVPNHVSINSISNSDLALELKTNYYRLTENVYLGNINSIKNERKMCKLNIEYLIDMTNMKPEDVNRKTLGKLPCLCTRPHSRLYLSVEILETSFKSLFNSFGEINKFIQRARRALNDKRVLIFGLEIYSPQLITAAAQYLMVEYEMNLDTALKTILPKNYSIIKSKLESSYLNYLKDFELYLRQMSISLYGSVPFNCNDSFEEEVKNKHKFDFKHDCKLEQDIFEKDYGYLELEKNSQSFELSVNNDNEDYDDNDKDISSDEYMTPNFKPNRKNHKFLHNTNLKKKKPITTTNNTKFNLMQSEENKSKNNHKISKHNNTTSFKMAWM